MLSMVGKWVHTTISRDFAYCDSDDPMVISGWIAVKGKTLNQLVSDRMAAYPLQATNSKLADPQVAIAQEL